MRRSKEDGVISVSRQFDIKWPCRKCCHFSIVDDTRKYQRLLFAFFLFDKIQISTLCVFCSQKSSVFMAQLLYQTLGVNFACILSAKSEQRGRSIRVEDNRLSDWTTTTTSQTTTMTTTTTTNSRLESRFANVGVFSVASILIAANFGDGKIL